MKIMPVYVIAGMLLATAVLWTTISSGDEVDEGKMIYENKCMICHGVKGDGNGTAAAFLNSKPADFTDSKFWENHNDQQIADVIKDGKGEMPAFDLVSSEMKLVIGYITHTFKPTNK